MSKLQVAVINIEHSIECLFKYSSVFFARVSHSLTLLVTLLLFLSGCYLPDKFELDIRVTKNGEYALRYRGDLVSVNLSQKILRQELSEEELSEQLEVYYRDLQRESSFSEVTHIGDGVFRVKYLYVSGIKRQPYYTFIRGNNKIFTIRYNKSKGILSLLANQLSDTDKKRIGADKYKPTGRIRIISDLKVLNHNADQILDTKTPSYVWNVDPELDSVPFVNFAL